MNDRVREKESEKARVSDRAREQKSRNEKARERERGVSWQFPFSLEVWVSQDVEISNFFPFLDCGYTLTLVNNTWLAMWASSPPPSEGTP